MTNPRAVEAGLEDLTGEVDDLLSSISTGTPVDLTGFDRRVEAICAAATDLGPRDAATIATRMRDLVDRLDRLTQTLAAAADADTDRTDRLTRARAAYRPPDGGH